MIYTEYFYLHYCDAFAYISLIRVFHLFRLYRYLQYNLTFKQKLRHLNIKTFSVAKVISILEFYRSPIFHYFELCPQIRSSLYFCMYPSFVFFHRRNLSGNIVCTPDLTGCIMGTPMKEGRRSKWFSSSKLISSLPGFTKFGQNA